MCCAIEPHLEELGLDQLIFEFEAWTHVGRGAGTPRHQILTIDMRGTRLGLG